MVFEACFCLASIWFSAVSPRTLLFIYRQNGIFLALLIYVDDLVLARNSSEHCRQFKSYLQQCFKLKDLGALKYFLGIEVEHSSEELFLCQRKYTLDMPNQALFLWSKITNYPLQ